MRHRTLVLALSLLVLASACGERAEPVGPKVDPYPVTVRGGGERPTVVTRTPERIVALDAGSAELIAAVGAGARLVGVPSGIDLRGRRDARRVVGPSGRVDVAVVVRARPDLLVATPETDPVDVSLARRRSGARLYVEPARSLAGVERAVLELGFLVDEPVRARRLAASLHRRIAEVERRVAAVDPVPVFIDTGFFITVPERSLLGDLVRRAGGKSVAGAEPGSEPFRPCEVVRLHPEVILTTESRTALLRRLAGAGRCAASFDVRVVALQPDLVTRAGPRVSEALAAIARALHPDAFTD